VELQPKQAAGSSVQAVRPVASQAPVSHHKALEALNPPGYFAV
jgi:hypothetical protein